MNRGLIDSGALTNSSPDVEMQLVGERPTVTTTGESFPFLRLPNEVRNFVYKHLLINGSKLRRCESIKPARAGRMLAKAKEGGDRPLQVHRNEVRLPVWKNTALLYTCRTAYNEGLSILYSYNELHFPALGRGLMLNKRQQISFSLLTRVSFDYAYTFSDTWDAWKNNVFWTEDAASHVDTTISKCVKQLDKHSPVLKALTIHLVTFSSFVHLTALAAHDRCNTTSALAALSPRLNRLTIVGMPEQRGAVGVLCPREQLEVDHMSNPGLESSAYAVLNKIAPWKQWREEGRAPPGWLNLTVNPKFVERELSTIQWEEFRLYENDREVWYMKYMKAMEPYSWHLERVKDGADI